MVRATDFAGCEAISETPQPLDFGKLAASIRFESGVACGVDRIDYRQPNTGPCMSILSTYRPEVSIERRHVDILG